MQPGHWLVACYIRITNLSQWTAFYPFSPEGCYIAAPFLTCNRPNQRLAVEWNKESMMRVLIADDHDLLRDTLVLFLQGQGDIETSTAANLAEACKLIETQARYDLVLLDLNMPGMNGLAGLNRLLL